ncbi:hypothetical protein D3C87_1680240 [compost metagenome]
MPEVGVKCASSVELVVPRHRVVVTHFAVFISLLVDLDEHVYLLIEVLEIIKLVFDLPFFWKTIH